MAGTIRNQRAEHTQAVGAFEFESNYHSSRSEG